MYTISDNIYREGKSTHLNNVTLNLEKLNINTMRDGNLSSLAQRERNNNLSGENNSPQTPYAYSDRQAMINTTPEGSNVEKHRENDKLKQENVMNHHQNINDHGKFEDRTKVSEEDRVQKETEDQDC